MGGGFGPEKFEGGENGDFLTVVRISAAGFSGEAILVVREGV